MHHHTIVRHEIMCAPGVQPFKDACSCNNPRMKGKTKKEKQLFFTEVGLWMSLIFPLKFLWTLFYKQMFIYKWTDVQNPSRLQHSNFHVQIKWLNYTSQYFPMIFLTPKLRWGERRFHSPVHFHLPPCLELKPILSTVPWAETSLFFKAESPLTQGYPFILILLTLWREREGDRTAQNIKQLEICILYPFSPHYTQLPSEIFPPPSLTRWNDPINMPLPKLFLTYKAVLILHSCVWLLGLVIVSPTVLL